MNELLAEGFRDALVENFYRSIIVTLNESEILEGDHYDVTKIGNGMYYLSLTDSGVNKALIRCGLNEKEIEEIVALIELKEKEQKRALINFLKLEQGLKSSIVYVMLRDGRVDTDEELFRDTYCLPLSDFFECLVTSNFKPMRVDTIQSSTNIVKEEYSKYLFNDSSYQKMVSVFINVDSDKVN